MIIKNTYQTMYKSGSTDDIISVVMYAYEKENDPQIRALAENLKGDTEIDSCRNIFNYLLENINYRADKDPQEIKTPARLIHDGTGDCKSYAVMTACCLKYMGIDHIIRFVSYDDEKEATHVYCVAIINGNYYPVDAVAGYQKGLQAGQEIKYTYRCDMARGSTKIAYLAGTDNKPSLGEVIDSIQQNPDFEIWFDGEREENLTFAKQYLLALWSNYWVIMLTPETNAEYYEAANSAKYVAQAIKGYNKYRNDNKKLLAFGWALEVAYANKAFFKEETDLESTDFFSDYWFEMLEISMDDYSGQEPTIFKWTSEVVAQNKMAGIGAAAFPELTKRVQETGPYYLYSIGIPQSDINNIPVTVAAKRNYQKMLYNTTQSKISSQMGYNSYALAINTGLRYEYGMSAETQVARLKAGMAGIGSFVSVAAIITTVVSWIGQIIKWFSPEDVPNEATAKNNAAALTDFPSNNNNNNQQEAGFSSNLLLYGGLALAALSVLPMIAKNDKKRKK